MTPPKKRVAIVQSNYLPWKGYFDIIASVDLFVFFDDVEYSKKSSERWRNRNLFKTAQGPAWLTVPVRASFGQRICDVEIDGDLWKRKHLEFLRHNYRKAPAWERLKPFLEELYDRNWTHLSVLNQFGIVEISRRFLGLNTQFVDASSLAVEGRRQERLLNILKAVEGGVYLSGPAARDYIEPTGFAQVDIGLEWMQYDAYEPYEQFHPPFVHGVSIIDLIAQTGDAAAGHLHRRTTAT